MKIKLFAILDEAKLYKENIRFKLGGGHVYDRSSVWTAMKTSASTAYSAVPSLD
jgi:hypothetical protein